MACCAVCLSVAAHMSARLLRQRGHICPIADGILQAQSPRATGKARSRGLQHLVHSKHRVIECVPRDGFRAILPDDPHAVPHLHCPHLPSLVWPYLLHSDLCVPRSPGCRRQAAPQSQ